MCLMAKSASLPLRLLFLESALEPARPWMHQAPRFLPLLHRMEERAGEEVRFYWFPLSSVLPTRSSRGEDGELDAALPAGAAGAVALPPRTGPEGVKSFARDFFFNPPSFLFLIFQVFKVSIKADQNHE